MIVYSGYNADGGNYDNDSHLRFCAEFFYEVETVLDDDRHGKH